MAATAAVQSGAELTAVAPTPENAPGAATRWTAAAQLLSGSSRGGRAAARARAARADAGAVTAIGGDVESGKAGGQAFLLPVHSLHFDASSLYGRLYGNTLAAAPGGGGEAALVCGVQTPRGAAAAAAAAAAAKRGCCAASDEEAAGAVCPVCGHEAAAGDLCGFEDGCSVCGHGGSSSCTTTPAATCPNSRVDSSAAVAASQQALAAAAAPGGPLASAPSPSHAAALAVAASRAPHSATAGPSSSDSSGAGAGAGAASGSSRTGPVSAGRLVVIVQPHTILMGLQPRLQPAPNSNCGESTRNGGSTSSGGSSSEAATAAGAAGPPGSAVAAAPAAPVRGVGPHARPAPDAARLTD